MPIANACFQGALPELTRPLLRTSLVGCGTGVLRFGKLHSAAAKEYVVAPLERVAVNPAKTPGATFARHSITGATANRRLEAQMLAKDTTTHNVTVQGQLRQAASDFVAQRNGSDATVEIAKALRGCENGRHRAHVGDGYQGPSPMSDVEGIAARTLRTATGFEN